MTKELQCPYCGSKISKHEFDTVEAKLRDEIEKKLCDERAEIAKEYEKLKEKKDNADDLIERRVAKLLEEKLGKKTKQNKREIEELKKEINQYIDKETEWEKQKRGIEKQKRLLNLQIEKESEKKAKELFEDEVKIVTEEHEIQLKKKREEHEIQLKEKERIIENFKNKYEEAERKARKGSAQQKGLIQQHSLAETLQDCFREDNVEEVKSGVRGADIVQTVMDKSGTKCGTILWESKRANWSKKWIGKLRDDKRRVKADFGILVSETLPKEVDYFSADQNLVITSELFAVGLATIFRNSLIDAKKQHLTLEQKESVMGSVFDYVTSNSFVEKLKTIVESEYELYQLIEKERRSHESLWSQRETLHKKAAKQACLIYGDIKAHVRGLPKVDLLELPE